MSILSNLHCTTIVQDLLVFSPGETGIAAGRTAAYPNEKEADRLPQATISLVGNNNPEGDRVQKTNWTAEVERLSTEKIRRGMDGVKGKAGAAKLS